MFFLLRYFKNTKVVKYLLTYKLVYFFYNFMEKNIAAYIQYNEKETRLFSQSFIGYWITKSNLSIFCRILSIGLLFISSITSYISTFVGYYPQLFLSIHLFSIVFAMITFGLYLSVSIFLSIKHAKALCSNSPISFWSCVNFSIRLCSKVAAASVLGVGIVPIDWTCERAGIKPIFMWAYYPGLKRLAGDITPQLAEQPSKNLNYVNEKLPFSKQIHYLQEKTDIAEAKLAEEYRIQQENRK